MCAFRKLFQTFSIHNETPREQKPVSQWKVWSEFVMFFTRKTITEIEICTDCNKQYELPQKLPTLR